MGDEQARPCEMTPAAAGERESLQWAVAASLLLLLTLVLSWTALRRPVVVGFAASENPQRDRPDMRLELNAASAHDLQTLPRLGPTMAARIVADREANGPFLSLHDLQRVPGIGMRTVELIAPHVVIGAPPREP